MLKRLLITVCLLCLPLHLDHITTPPFKVSSIFLNPTLSSAEKKMVAEVFDVVYNVNSIPLALQIQGVKKDNPNLSLQEISRRLSLR